MAGRSYDGKGIRVLWRAERDIHSAECTRHLPGVFDPERRPWIDAEAADAEETRVALCRCGATANPPFCDNSHKRTGFAAGAGNARPKADATCDGSHKEAP